MQNPRQLRIGAGLLVAMLATGAGSLGSAGAGEATTAAASGPIVGEAEAYALSVPARHLAPADGSGVAAPQSRINPLGGEPAGAAGGSASPGEATDPLALGAPRATARTPALDLRFEGTGNPSACGGCSPPDTNGDVGPRHYVQMVNATKVAIFDKSGTPLRPPFDLGDLWPRSSCRDNFGDPIVLYDGIADRWLLSQFASPSHLCIAISRTGNPLGSYHLFRFNVGQFPDYFKVGVWRNAYYVSANESTYTAYAFDRAKMLAGDQSASFVKFTGQTNFLLPADLDGPTPAAATAGGLFYTFKDNNFHGGVDRIELFRLRPDFANPANSAFNLVESIPVARFVYTVCGFFNFECAKQKGTSQRVDVVSEWPMHRFVYRRFASHETLLGNFTVGGGQGQVGSAIRWFELRRDGGRWALYQEGTHDPAAGDRDRFMGSIAMDGDGNIALGYSVSNAGLFPSVRYATRAPDDPLGTLGAERTLQEGGGSQTASDRWGDYTAMTVDPVTDCQFWHTNQFYKRSSPVNWKTVVGAFTVPGCGP